MTFLPIVGRELVVAARRPGTHRVRFWAALVTLGVWLLVFTSSRYVAPGEMGIHLLNALGVLALAFSLFAGVFRTADCLSEEKREGTLGLLFLTDLRAYDVVLGKLVAGSLDTFFGLLAIFPILGLTLMLGGVTGAEFWRLALVFVTTLFFSLGIGMFASAISHDARQAMSRGILLLVVFAGLLPVLWGACSYLLGSRAPDWLLLPSPAYAYSKAFAAQYHSWTGPDAFWYSLGTVFCLGLVGIVAANFILPRTWQQTASAPVRRPRAEKKRALLSRENAALRGVLLNFNPIYWLNLRDLGAGRVARRVLYVLFALWFAIWNSSFTVQKNNEAPFVICIFLGYGLHQLIKLMVATQASQRMSQDRQSGALELLLVTPVPVESILSGQMKALRHHFRVPMILAGLINVGLWLTLAAPAMHMNGREAPIFIELFVGGVVMLILDFYALCWVGMWQGLNAPRHSRAVLGTILRVMGIPWLAIFFLFFLRFGGSPGSVAFMFGAWFVVGAVVDMTVATTARQKLKHEFRRAAAGRFGGKNG